MKKFLNLFFIVTILLIVGCKDKIKTDVPIKGDPIITPILDEPIIKLPTETPLTDEGKLFIITEETGGKSYYNKFLKFPTVPPGASGITIGAGYDLQFYQPTAIKKTWIKLGDNNTTRLSKASGLNHTESQSYLPKVKDILVSWDLATEVFNINTIPDYYDLTRRTFPGLTLLKAPAIAAATSVIFNRGSSLTGDARKEMRGLKEAIKNKDYQEMADQTRAMKRLWYGKGMDGVILRREKEAKLYESCL